MPLDCELPMEVVRERVLISLAKPGKQLPLPVSNPMVEGSLITLSRGFSTAAVMN